jgi:hypothetical protein
LTGDLRLECDKLFVLPEPGGIRRAETTGDGQHPDTYSSIAMTAIVAPAHHGLLPDSRILDNQEIMQHPDSTHLVQPDDISGQSGLP